MKIRHSSYASSGALAAVLSAITWFLLDHNNCSADQSVRTINYLALVVGIILFSLSFFDLAGNLYEVMLLFYAAVIGLIVLAVATFYAAYLSFKVHCSNAGWGSNVFNSNDPAGICIFVLSILVALCITSAAVAFSKRF